MIDINAPPALSGTCKQKGVTKLPLQLSKPFILILLFILYCLYSFVTLVTGE